MDTIPAIDLLNGQVVRLTAGDYDRSQVYASDPVEVAKMVAARGYRRLHLVDLDGARAGKVINLAALKGIVAATDLVVDFGGGLRDDEQVRRVLEAGAQQFTAGSIAVRQPGLTLKWLERYGPEVVILGMDVRGSRVAIHGWQDSSALDWPKFLADYRRAGVKRVICTDVERDGMMGGPALDLYREILEQAPELELVASGGIRGEQDLDACAELGCHGAIVGKAILEDLFAEKLS